MSSPSTPPRRGEIWRVNFNPTVGAEIQKVRPAVIISSDAVGRLPLKLVAPVTEWQPAFEGNVWHVKIAPTATNGLTKVSAVDALQVRSVSLNRLADRIGRLTEPELEEVIQALAAVIEFS